ncbi:MAG: hypothetical protein BRC32_07110 [Actinobacteria bacterium QS_8_72_14]|nr:MAG: hypothetical protein BRC32_07110 [Actinobacteria bacterium QS_8_72_14]
MTMANSAGWTDELTTIYLATGLSQKEAPEGFASEAEEAAMAVVRLGLGVAIAEVVASDRADAKTVAGLLLAERRSDSRQQP